MNRRLIEGVLKHNAPTAPSVLGKPRRKEPDWRKMAEVVTGAYMGNALGGTLGGTTGANLAARPHIRKHKKAEDELNKRMYPPESGDSRLSRKGVNLLDPKAFISAKHYKEKLPSNTTWVNTPKQAEKEGRGDTFDAVSKRKESPYMVSTLDSHKFTVVTPPKRKIARDVVAHEVGHVKDYKADPPKSSDLLLQMFGRQRQSALPREKAAWNASGVPQGSAIRKHALDTYKHAERIPGAAQAGGAIGVVGGSAIGALAGGLAAAKNVDKRRATNLKKASGRINLLHTKPQIAREDTITREKLIEAIVERAENPPLPNDLEYLKQLIKVTQKRRADRMLDRSPTVRAARWLMKKGGVGG